MNLAQPAVRATRTNPSLLLAACIVAGATFAAGCAGTPEPTEQLVAARQAVTAAEQAQAVEHAADLMTESRIDAELATAQAAATKAEAVNDEMRRGNETLIDEMQRQNGAGGTR